MTPSIVLRDDQERAIKEARSFISQGFSRILMQAPCGFGKCLGRGTPVLMFDGSVKSVEDVVVGDLLMGPDSKPRRVESLARGREKMYRVHQKVGDPYVVNESHILSLRMGKANWGFNLPDGSKANAGDLVNIEVRDFLRASRTFQSYAKGWHVAVEFPRRSAPKIPPYVLGAWLGDGASKGASLTTSDTVIADEFVAFGKKLGLVARIEQNSEWSVNVHLSRGTRGGSGQNAFVQMLCHYDLRHNKHIPDDYLLGSERVRLEVLAGLIDTDGTLCKTVYTITQKSPRLSQQIAFLARSLGFSVSVNKLRKTCTNNGVSGEYYSIGICGDTNRIPCRLDRKKADVRRINKNHTIHGIKLEELGEDDYFGFEISGPDRLFLLGDFTVTHNTVLASFVAQGVFARKKALLFLVHRTRLLRQSANTFDRFGVKYGFIAAGLPYDPNQQIYIGMIGTVYSRIKREKLNREFDVVAVDECHRAVSPSWRFVLDHLHKSGSTIMGFSATPKRLDGKPMSDVFDVMVKGPQVQELIDRGSLAPFTYYAPPSLIDLSQVGHDNDRGDFRAKELDEATDRAEVRGDAVKHYKRLLSGKRTIVFTTSVKAATKLADVFCRAGVPAGVIHGKMLDKEREEVEAAFDAGRILVLVNVEIATEGFDCPECDGVIMLRATQSEALYLQMAMRSMRPHPNKDRAIIIDLVGNFELGLPDEDRDWTLEAQQPKRRVAANDEDYVGPTQCPNCYRVHPRAPVCPHCGFQHPVKKRKEQKTNANEVAVELTPEMREALRRKKAMENRQAKTLEEMVEIGKARGYKNPVWWAKKRMEGRERRAR